MLKLNELWDWVLGCTVEPPYNGHFGTVLTCPLYGGVLNWEVKIHCKYNGRDQCGVSSIQRCPLLGVSVNGVFCKDFKLTVYLIAFL